MLDEWPEHDRLDAKRIGAFGFSNGGFTVPVTAGGVPDLDRTAIYCQANRDHDLGRALAQAGVDPHLGKDIPPDAWRSDPRIRAVVVAAPAFGFAFNETGLRNVHIPIQLWRAAEDHHQPNPWYDEFIEKALPQRPEYHVVAGAGHYDFLPPCSPGLAKHAPAICTDASGFDRGAFHREFNAEIVRFFNAALR